MHVDELLVRSHASELFKTDVLAYSDGETVERISTARRAPRVKVLRVIAQLTATHPDLAIDAIHVDAWAGCSDYRGHIDVRTSDGTRTFDFEWNCHWRAVQEGWVDAFGFPDQIRAAHEFTWQCFAHWTERSPEIPADATEQRTSSA